MVLKKINSTAKLKQAHVSSNEALRVALPISFAEWIIRNNWKGKISRRMDRTTYVRFEKPTEAKTTQELYEMFKKEMGNDC